MMSKSSDLQKNHEEELFEKAARYCVYQPRCSREVISKLIELGSSKTIAEKIAKKLQSQNYFNDQEFALSFAIGKNRNNKWGKIKIFTELIQRGIDQEKIKKALNNIDEEEYLSILNSLIHKKIDELKKSDNKIKYQKTLYYMASKGFEKNLIINILNNTLKSERQDDRD